MTIQRSIVVLATVATLSPFLHGCVPLIAGGAAGSALLVGSDRRSSGAHVDDQTLEVKIGQQIGAEQPDAHVNVTSFNRAVLLTGEAPDAASKTRIELIARGMPNVRRVFNELVIAPPSTLGNRLNDTSLTTKVKTRMLENREFAPNHVKVISERGEVFLLGLVTPTEGNTAARIASETAGVLKVHTLFEYLDPKTGMVSP